MKMKRYLPLWLGLLAFALVPVLAQTPKGAPGKIHGHVTNPSGVPQSGGVVSLYSVGTPIGPGMSAKVTDKGSFPVDANGDYAGEVPPGNYDAVYRAPNTPNDRVTDKFESIKIFAGQDLVQDFDMTRKEYIDTLPADERKQLEELRKKNAEVLRNNAVVNHINADIKAANQDLKDIDAAHATAVQALGATASRADLEAKENEIKAAKYADIETMMLKDTAAKPDASVLWAQLGQAQMGLKKYDEAEATYKKTLEVEAASKKPNPQTQGVAESGLGEIYARTGKVAEANAAYAAAAKINPAGAAVYLKNEAVIFSQVGNAVAQAAAADEAIKVDPTQPLPYYLKGQGLIGQATIDPATGKMILPPGCAEAYQKYLDLAPTGAFAADVKGILAEATQTHSSSLGVDKTKKKK
jgi:tetratricopeptide (TPR) repeat protein